MKLYVDCESNDDITKIRVCEPKIKNAGELKAYPEIVIAPAATLLT